MEGEDFGIVPVSAGAEGGFPELGVVFCELSGEFFVEFAALMEKAREVNSSCFGVFGDGEFDGFESILDGG